MENPFEDFLNELNFEGIEGEPQERKVKAIDLIERFIDKLVKEYGLPEDEDARQMIYDIICEAQILANFIEIGKVKWIYLKAFVLDRYLKGEKPETVILLALAYGVALGRLLTYE